MQFMSSYAKNLTILTFTKEESLKSFLLSKKKIIEK